MVRNIVVVIFLFPLLLAAQTSNVVRRLEASDRGAAAQKSFWERAQSSPIVEDGSDDHHKRVTFVWKGEPGTKNVIVVTPMSVSDFSGSVLKQIAGTNVWYRTYELPRDARFTYRFGINDSLVPFDQDKNIFARMSGWRVDPLNPKQFEIFPGMKASVLELADAPSDALTSPRQGVARGSVVAQKFSSKRLNAEITMHVYKAPGVKPDGSAPVVLFNDGDSYLNLMSANVILDNLVADHTIPPMIAVFVENVPNGREKFLNCTPEWNELLARELMDEVVGKEKAASRDALRHVVVGYSLGGLAAGCAAKAHPEVFGAVIAQSGSFFRAPEGEPPEWLARQIATTPSVQQKWYVEIGRLESAPIPNRDPSMLTASRHLRDVLNAKGYSMFYVEHFNGHEHIAWRATLGDALTRVLGSE